MKTWTLDDLSLDIGTHFRHEADGHVSEGFVVDCYKSNGVTRDPIDIYPNQVHPHPEATHRMTIFWYGKLVLPVTAPFNARGQQITEEQARELILAGQPVEYRQVATKRGGDFRTRMFPTLQYLVRKRQIASLLGKSISQVSQDDILQVGIKYADFTEELRLEMKALTLDDAVREVWGEEPVIVSRVPRGTVSNIDCDFDSRADSSGSDFETLTTITLATTQRGQWRFPLAATITAGSTIADVDWQGNQTAESGTGQTADIYAYNADGQADPDADDGATKYSRSLSATQLVNEFSVATVSSKTTDLGATADGHVQANITTPGWYSVGMTAGAGTGAGETFTWEALEHADSDPATLIVDWTAPAAGVVPQLATVGVGT